MTEQRTFPKMIDTIAAMHKVPEVSRDLFPGEAVSSNSETRHTSARWYRNEDGKPRVTYYPQSEWLRIEFSLQRLDSVEVDEYLARALSLSVPPVMTWRCQRVDYMVDIEVGNVAPYLAAISRLQVGAMSRHPFPDGVVWKARGRWVKFYDGKHHDKAGVLRFEVSNYKQAVRYMAEKWFGCERTVQELVMPGRVLYVLGRMWERLGLDKGFAHEESEVSALRAAFGGRSLAGAIHALRCVRVYGVDSYKTLQLMSRSSYYRWSSALRSNGFLASGSSLSSIHLPTESFFATQAQNLKVLSTPLAPYALDKIAQKSMLEITQKNLCKMLGVKPTAPRVKYLEDRFSEQFRLGVDPREGQVEDGNPVDGVPAVTSGLIVGTGSD